MALVKAMVEFVYQWFVHMWPIELLAHLCLLPQMEVQTILQYEEEVVFQVSSIMKILFHMLLLRMILLE